MSNLIIENQFKEFKKKKFIFLVYSGRSGKSLFSGLLDVNKKILVMHYSNKILSETDNLIKINKDNISDQIIEKSFLKKIKSFNENKKIKFKKILDYLIKKNNFKDNDLIILVYFCYAKVFNYDLKKIELIFLDCPYLDNFLLVEKYFKNPKFVYLARNPYNLFFSLKNLYYEQYFNSNIAKNTIQNINLYSLEIIKRSLSFFDKKRYHLIIKYEDMQKNPKFFLDKLSQFTNTKMIYTNNLTFLNSPKISNSSVYKHNSKINENIDNYRYKSSLLQREIDLITLMFSKYFKILGYNLENIKYSKYKLILVFFFLFKNELIPNKKIFKIKSNNELKNSKLYIYFKYIYYVLINFLFYPKNLFKIYKIILSTK